MKEIRILLNEPMFTQLCKTGFYTHQNPRTEITFSKLDIKSIAIGDILEKEIDGILFKFALQDIGSDLIIEIVRRSPIYSDLSYDI